MHLSPDHAVVQARALLERRALAMPGLLAPEIQESWRRCLAAGLDPGRPPPVETMEAPVLQRMRDQRAVLYRLALAEMQTLYHQIAGSNFMIAFAAPDGVLLETMSDASFGKAASRNALRPGMIWTETACGTNALGTAIATGRPVSVHGPEHFFTRYGGLTCVAAPILGPDGVMAGVLDASSNCASRQSHTRALVGMAATQIENGLLRDRHRRDLLIAFHSRREYLFTLSAGLMAFAADGRLLAANRQARFLLAGLPADAGRHFDDLFATRFTAFIDGPAAQEQRPLTDHAGSAYVAVVETARPHPPAAPARPMASSGFIAEDEAVIQALRLAAAAAERRIPILIRGETGTGKEQVARHVHRASGRSGDFIPVNCAALPETLIEAELFGHAEGAFTGARRGGARGLIMEADGGTLFLDEIGDMPLPAQAVLLRLLDDWTVRPVGGGKRRVVDVQLVAATNTDLAAAIPAGRFRADLLYRVNTVELLLPPLRERRDFATLARHLLAGIAPDARLSAETLIALAAQPWPGNIRELISVLTRLSLTRTHGEIGAHRLPQPLLAAPDNLHQAQRRRIQAVHQETGNVSATARRLGIARNTVYRALTDRQ
jgi:transcriptional regulator of acetoin/glycerol metabolism